MASSKVRALVVSIVVVLIGGLGGTIAWRHAHPQATSPLAALSPMVMAPAPTPAVPSPPAKTAAPLSAATPAAPAGPNVADLGPEPPTAPDPVPGTSAGPAAMAGGPPSFDVVRVEPSGETVVAGKGTPDTDVALIASGQVVAEGKADANGQFVLIPPPLKPGSYDLTLRQGQGANAQSSKQAVAVAIPDKRKGDVVVALAEPGQPTRILSAPVAPASASKSAIAAVPSATGSPVAIRSVELENGNGFFATGRAPPGTQLHIYLNNSHVADVAAASDGQWTLRIGKGLTGGHYTVRADALKQDGRTVASRVEVPFDVPVAMAKGQAGPAAAGRHQMAAGESKTRVAGTTEIASAATARSAAEPGPVGSVSPGDTHQPPSRGSDAVIESLDTALVARGDNLWDISRVRLGNGTRYTRIYTANAGQIRDPNLIYPGQVFVVPHD